jgi:Ca-activated chloride channel family protein
MKTGKTSILILSGIFLFSCGSNKTKTQDDTVENVITETGITEETESTPPPPPRMVDQKFVPPVIMEDREAPDNAMASQDELQKSKIQISAVDIRSVENNKSIEIAELREYKVVAGEREVSTPFMSVESPRDDNLQNEEYSRFTENKFRLAKEEPLSTFSVDVDAASYSNMRRFINRGALPNKDAIRIEELINYFSYDYPEPTGKDPVRITAEVGSCPWNNQNRLVRIGLKARNMAGDNLPASNFVFLIDVSGSMNGPTRLDLVKSSLKLLTNNLREKDRVAIVVYASATGLVLPSTSGSNKQKIKEALDNLKAGGSTAGGAGIRLAYKIAGQNFITGGNNRIILCTDGDFNVGVSDNDGLQKLIEEERKSGVFLSILGYGMGNYKDSKMQTLAQAGNGNHAYIDNLQEANKVLVNEFGATMYTVAKDVKLQLEFNPAKVQAYRLVGYETRLLNKEDFNDDTKDAGEMGAGHTVTALYEVIPVGVRSNLPGNVDPLKYRNEPSNTAQYDFNPNIYPDLLTIKLRYKEPDSAKSRKMEIPLIDNNEDDVSDDFRFASAVAMFGQVIKNSQYKGDGNFDKAITLAQKGYGDDKQGYRREFVRLMETAKGLAEN